jgi:hypothetical protein
MTENYIGVDISEINEGRKPAKKIYMKNYGRPAGNGICSNDDCGGGEWVAKVDYNIGGSDGGVEGKCLAGAKLAPLL